MITPAVWKASFEVNTTDAGPSGSNQFQGRVAADADGGFYVFWTDASGTTPSSNGWPVTVGRHYDAYGNALTGEMASGLSPTDSSDPIVLANRTVDVAFRYNGGDTSVYQYNSNLVISSVLAVESGGTPSVDPAVTGFADNGMFVTYTLQNSASDQVIIGHTISSSGVVGAPITIASNQSSLLDHIHNSRLATLDNNSFVVAYESINETPGPEPLILFQVRSEDGTLQHSGGVQVVSSNPASNPHFPIFTAVHAVHPDVAALRSGGYAITYQLVDSTDIGVMVYDSAGTSVRNNVVVNTTTAGVQSDAQIAAMDDGGFLISWNDETAGVQRAQRFDASGNHVGQEVVTHVGSFSGSDLATLADGRTLFSVDDTSAGSGNIVDSIFETRTNVTTHVTGHDLFGDGSADILIVRDTGQTDPVGQPGGLATMYDLSATGTLTQIGQVGTDWSVAASGDFNADGRGDLLMQYDSGGLRDLYSFTMGSMAVTAITKLGTVGTDWQVDGTGDFNHDGTADILLERTVGPNKELDIIGVQNNAVTTVTTAGVVSSNYQVDGIGDLNKDGTSDILLHSDDALGRHFTALIEGNYTTQSVANVATVGTEWQADGLGDFNGDGYADILIQSDSASMRELGVLINQAGGGWVFKDLGPVGKNIEVDGIGDFNHDGTADISAHYDPTGTSRTDIYFEIHNSTVTAIHAAGAVGHEWIVT